MSKPIIIIGYGGHAAEVIATATAMMENDSTLNIEGFVDADPSGKPAELLNLPLLGDDSLLSGAEDKISLHIAIGDNNIRREIAKKFSGFEFATFIHPSAIVGPLVEIGEGALVAPGAILTARIKIGRHVIINTGAIISHDCVLGDFSNVSPGSVLAGKVHLGDGAFLGCGVNIAPGVKVGDDAFIAVGSTVTKDVNPGLMVAGSPARVIKGGHPGPG